MWEEGNQMQVRKNRLRFMGLSAMMAALLCIMSPITLPVGVLPVTLSVLALFLVATLFPAKVSVLAVAVYLALGALGLPVFAAFTGGAATFVSPSGGFLWGYLPAVLVVSLLCQKSCGRVLPIFLSMLLGLLILYAVGMFGFGIFTDTPWQESFLIVILPFLVPDLMKIIVVLVLYFLLYRRVETFVKKDSCKGETNYI